MGKINLVKNTIDNHDIDRLIDWLKGYPRLTKGELNLEFEKKFANWMGRKYAIFCNSGSSANLLMLSALNQKLDFNIKSVVVPSVAAVYTDEVSLPKPMIVYSVVSISNGSSKRYNALELSFTSGAVSDERASPKRFVKCNDSITPLNSPPFPPKNK